MSRIDKLVRQLCPDGVEFKHIWEVTAWDKKFNAVGNHKQAKTRKYIYLLASALRKLAVENGDVKLLSTGGEVYGYTTEELAGNNISEGEIIAIPWGGKATVQYYSGKFVTADNRIATSLNKDYLDNKYLYYFMLGNLRVIQSFYRGSGIQHPSMAKVLEMKLPIPPIEVQKEIVNILDKFTQLEAELSAELSARRHQHAYYWNHLLAPRETWETTTLGEIADVFDGPHATPKKTATGPWYLSISSLKNGRVDLTESAHLGEDEYPTWIRRVAPRVGDTLFSYETRVGQAAYWDTDEPAALGRRMGLLRPHVDLVHPRFLTLLYLGPQFQKLIQAKTVKGSTVDRIPIANMASWKVIIPSLDEQAEIVRQVDAFDALVNDLKVGLPAELTARRKQYEYYRTKLLTFQELTV